MSNIMSRVKQILLEPKVTLKKVKHKFKQNPNDAWGMILSDVKGDTKNLYHNVRKRIPIKYKSSNQFSIVSACYNVSSYLDDFFKSIVSQSLSFKKHIQIICVDDGSTDNTAEIIKKWQSKYPDNIHYYYKENGGQASARNLGIEYVNTDWVTFIDPDDFINPNYFKEICDALKQNNNISMVVSNLKFFIESEKLIKDTHPLKYRFNKKYNIFQISDLKKSINLSASSTIFKTNVINSYKLEFNANIKPNFEDGKFIADYFLQDMSSDIIFVRDAVYFYRKRENGSSTIDTSWHKIEKYSNVLEYGFLEMLNNYKNSLGSVPIHIQRTALYDMSWYIRYLFNTKKIDILTSDERDKFIFLLKSIFKFIDSETILNFELAGIWWMHKIAILGFFKDEKPSKNIIYIENIDREKSEICLTFYSHFNENISIFLDDKEILPTHSKCVEYEFCGEPFVKERRIWIKYSNINSNIYVKVNGVHSRISAGGKHFSNIRASEVINRFKFDGKYISDGRWLLIDRDVQADDNAEHLYRFIKNNYPQEKIYFALRKSSHDWDRLKNDGFNLVDFGSKEFEKVLCKSSKIISSHLDRYINNYFGDEYQFSKKFVFLQHGITKDDMSNWFNMKKNLNCLVTATNDEYNSIAYGNTYKLSNKEVVLTGFPRHDKLLSRNITDSKIILIMPTWRENIVGHIVANGNQRELNKTFSETSYAKNWRELLNSKELESLVIKYGYELIFAPHANIVPYLEQLNIPDYISIWTAQNSSKSIQELFQSAKLMITDYSSVAFEMAFLRKLVIYFQFDYEEVYNKQSHIYKPGYFTYNEKGFGPVVFNVENVLNELDKSLKNNGEPLEPYKSRIEETFPFRDGKNCERVYQAIKALDIPELKEIDLCVLEEYAELAYKNEDWPSLITRADSLLLNGNTEQKAKAKKFQVYSLLGLGQFDLLEQKLSSSGLSNEEKISILAKKAFLKEKWTEVIHYLCSVDKLNKSQYFMILRSYAEIGDSDSLKELLSNFEQINYAEKIVTESYLFMANQSWKELIDFLNGSKDKLTENEWIKFKIGLLLAKAYRKIGIYNEAHQHLLAYEKYITDDHECRLEISHLAFSQKNYSKVIFQLESIYLGVISSLPESSIVEYLISYREMNVDLISDELLIELENKFSSNIDILSEVLFIYNSRKNWEKIELLSNELKKIDKEKATYFEILSKFRQGKFFEAYNEYVKPNQYSSYNYLELIYEVALINNDVELARSCLNIMIAVYPENNKEENIRKLILLLQK